jgi:TolA-binding protein
VLPLRYARAARLATIDRLAAPSRAKAYVSLAYEARARGDHEFEEQMLRKAADLPGANSDVAQEAGYQLGWARTSQRDYSGAREAWLEAARAFPTGHSRVYYARFYAAESAAKSQEERVAQDELEILIRDIESDASRAESRATILKRSRSLLDSLQN